MNGPLPLEEWQRLGVRTLEGAALPQGGLPGIARLRLDAAFPRLRQLRRAPLLQLRARVCAERRAAVRPRGRRPMFWLSLPSPCPHRRGRLRRHPAEPRDPPQLPDRRPLPLLARGDRPRAAPVHRHRQRRGAAVLARSAPLGLRVVEDGEQLLRRSAPTTTSSAPATSSSAHSAFPPHTPHAGEPGYDPSYPLPARRSSAATAAASTRSGRPRSSTPRR